MGCQKPRVFEHTEIRWISFVSALPQSQRKKAAAFARASGHPIATFQTIAIFEKIRAISEAAGISLQTLAKLRVYLENFQDFPAFDMVCKHYLEAHRPALTCIAIPRVSPFPKTRICIEAIGVKESQLFIQVPSILPPGADSIPGVPTGWNDAARQSPR